MFKHCISKKILLSKNEIISKSLNFDDPENSYRNNYIKFLEQSRRKEKKIFNSNSKTCPILFTFVDKQTIHKNPTLSKMKSIESFSQLKIEEKPKVVRVNSNSDLFHEVDYLNTSVQKYRKTLCPVPPLCLVPPSWNWKNLGRRQNLM